MKILFTLLLFTIISPALLAIEWEEIRENVPGNIEAMYKNGDEIYLGNVGMVKSTDGGSTFTKINKLVKDGVVLNLADENYKVKDIYKTSDNILFATVDSLNLLYSTDDGESWKESNLDSNSLVDCKFYEVGENYYIHQTQKYGVPNVLYKSTDKGMMWQKDSFYLENMSGVDPFEKSTKEDALLCLYTANHDEKYIVKYSPDDFSYVKYEIDDAASKFNILGDSWLLYMQDNSVILESKDGGNFLGYFGKYV